MPAYKSFGVFYFANFSVICYSIYMGKRLIKQIIYGSGFLAIVFLILLAIYFIWLKPEPTCSDGRRNQSEIGVDCGGPCAACEIKTLLPLQSIWQTKFSINGKAALTAQIKNSNSTYGANRFSYSFEIYGKNGNKIKTISGNSFIYASEIKYIFEPTDINYSDVEEIKVFTSAVQWLANEKFLKPKTQIREKITNIGEAGRGVEISGYVVNNNAYPLRKMRLVGFLATENNIKISVSKTELDNLAAFEERYFKIIFPKDIFVLSADKRETITFTSADPNRTEIYVEAIK